MEEEGLIFRRNKVWLESLVGDKFATANNATLALADNKLADVLISKYEFLDSCISNENFGTTLNNNLVLLLKFILENGSYLDSDINYREQIDMFFTMFRNLLRNHLKNLPESINVLILRLIESRACGWHNKPNIEEYYMKKIDKPSRHNVQPNPMHHCFEIQENLESFSSTGLRASKSYGDIMTNYKFDDAMFGRHKQLKSNSKAIMKDEVVIKNSDSGKVSPTARDRIVQISGQTVENINVAKNLINATIKQNVSPLPFNEFIDSNDTNYSQQSEEVYAQNEYSTNAAKYSSQSSANSLSETENPGYNFKFSIQGKEAAIDVSDKIIGQQLENFIQKFKFMEFIKGNRKEEAPPIIGDNGITKDSKDTKQYFTYDREFLLKFKEISPEAASRVINDIKEKQKHLFRS